MPRLANKTNVILFLADDIIRDDAIARSYLDLVSRQLEWRSPVSLVVTGDFNKTDGVFKSVSTVVNLEMKRGNWKANKHRLL